jgi:hypothetical protein
VPAVEIGPTLVPPLEVPTDPDQLSEPVPPDAVQEVALFVVQVSVVLCPVRIEVGEAVKLPIVAGPGVTVSDALPLPLVPSLPAQVSVKV